MAMPAVLAALVRATASAAASSLQGSGQFLRQLRNLLPDQVPFPSLPLLQAHQFVSQIERRQDRDAGRIGRIHVLGHLAHLAVHEIGQTLKVPAVVAAAYAVHPAKDLYFRAASGHGFHVRGPPAKPSSKYRDASGWAEAGLYHSFVTPQVRAKRVVSRIAGLPLPPFRPLGEAAAPPVASRGTPAGRVRSPTPPPSGLGPRPQGGREARAIQPGHYPAPATRDPGGL